MKTIKRIAALVIIVVVVFMIAAILGPKGFHMQRSIVIHAQKGRIFSDISDYRHWVRWSPWLGLDSTCRYEYYGPQGQADAGFRWSGDSQAGAGEMHTTEIAEDISLVSHLTFTRPFRSKSIATFTLDSVGQGDIKVTWGFDMDYPLAIRPMMLVMNMEKQLAPDYERGLANLKKVSERESHDVTADREIIKMEMDKRIYVGYRTRIPMDKVSALYQQWMPRVYTYVQAHHLLMDGAPSGLYYTWDTVAKMTDVAVAIPVKSAAKVSGDYQLLTVDAGTVIGIDYYGPYDRMGAAHAQISAAIAELQLKNRKPVIEEYITDPTSERDSSQIETWIYYPVQ